MMETFVFFVSSEKGMRMHQIAYDHALKSCIEFLHSKEAKHSSPSKLPRGSFVPIDMRRAYNKLFVQTTSSKRCRGPEVISISTPFLPLLSNIRGNGGGKSAWMFSHPRANKGVDWKVFALELCQIGDGELERVRCGVVTYRAGFGKKKAAHAFMEQPSFLIFFIPLSFIPRERYISRSAKWVNEVLKEDFVEFSQPSCNPSIISSTIIRGNFYMHKRWIIFNMDRLRKELRGHL